MKSDHFSLEEQLVEPFRAIRWIRLSPLMISASLLGLTAYIALWWLAKGWVFDYWAKVLKFSVKYTDTTWSIRSGYWPNHLEPWIALPKLMAAIGPPTQNIWWFFAALAMATWIFTETWSPVFLPLKALTRFILICLGISLSCFAISPLLFRHSVEEWSKIYFLGSYGSLLIYGVIWTFGVLCFPISIWVKIRVSTLLIIYELIGTPVLLIMCTFLLQRSSLLLLPLCALLIAPLVQLGWFVSFYSLALSSGADLNV